MSTTCGPIGFASRTCVGVAVLAVTLAWPSLTPARGQCEPQELPKLIASDAAMEDSFGSSVAISHDTAAIGASLDDQPFTPDTGSAYVFVRTGGVWSQQAKLIASDAAAMDHFGVSIAISGDTAVVGAWMDDLPGKTDAGSAYVYVRSGTMWSQQMKLIASDGAASDYFGISVAVSGDTAVVGAYGDNHEGGINAGSSYVFVRNGTVWTQQQKLTASDAAANDLFGVSIAISGNTAIVGAWMHDLPGQTNAGSAYIFVRSGTIWTQRSPLTASEAAEGDQFGKSVALAGETAVVGAHLDDNGGSGDVGAAYVFTPSGNVWTQRAKLTASDPWPGAGFGGDMAMDGDRVVVGAVYDSNTSAAFAGSAYVFDKPAAGWSDMTETHKLIASDAAMNDLFGTVAVSGDTVVVGARQDTHAAGQYAGSAYIFEVSCEIDTDGDGVLDEDDVCPTNGTGLPIDCTGRPLRDANNDCLVDPADVPFIVDELLSITIPPTGCNGFPLRDANGDTAVDGADLQTIVNELLNS